MSDEVQEIKNKIDLVEFIGGYFPVLKAGASSFKARCPFHQEKTPSFHISKDRQMWHCFGCSEGGDIFTFLMKMEGMEFRDALRLLAEKAGVTLQNASPKAASERRRLQDALALAARFYAALLAQSREAEAARAYLRRRGVSKEMIEAFELGFAPKEWDSLAKALQKRGFSLTELDHAGLLVRRASGSGSYDRFRERLMFPIRDVHGNVVGFTGRVLDPEAKEAKYVNTPQTLVYNKSETLYGIDLARQAIRTADRAILVEGNMDVIACHQIGMQNVIAVSGTALTEEQLRLLGRFTRVLAIAFDADKAGEAASRRGIDNALQAGFTVRMISIPEEYGKDPDECIKKDPEAWRRVVEKAEHLMDYLIRKEMAGKDLSDTTQKTAAGNAILGDIAKLPDEIEQNLWLQKLASLLGVPESVLREKLVRLGNKKSEGGTHRAGTESPSRPAPRPVKKEPPSRHRLLSESFVGLVLARSEAFPQALRELPPEMLSDGELRRLYSEAAAAYTQKRQLTQSSGEPGASEGDDALIRRLYFLGEQEYQRFTLPELEAAVHGLADALRSQWRSEQLRDLTRRMHEAEKAGDTESVAKLEAQVQALMTR